MDRREREKAPSMDGEDEPFCALIVSPTQQEEGGSEKLEERVCVWNLDVFTPQISAECYLAARMSKSLSFRDTNSELPHPDR